MSRQCFRLRNWLIFVSKKLHLFIPSTAGNGILQGVHFLNSKVMTWTIIMTANDIQTPRSWSRKNRSLVHQNFSAVSRHCASSHATYILPHYKFQSASSITNLLSGIFHKHGTSHKASGLTFIIFQIMPMHPHAKKTDPICCTFLLGFVGLMRCLAKSMRQLRCLSLCSGVRVVVFGQVLVSNKNSGNRVP